jgi:drug/metabolite transporter (DMT)-like permease
VLSIVLAALCAGVWGTGDFSGGKAAQKASPFSVALLSQLLGLPVLVACVILFSHGGPTGNDLLHSGLAGLAGFVGIVLLYRGLSQGAMSIFAPISAVTAALIPLIVGLVSEKTPSPLSLAGALCAIIAIGLVSISGHDKTAVTPRLIGLALASGGMFGVFFTLLGKSSPDAGAWPLVGVRIGSIGLGLVVVIVSRTSLRMPAASWRWSAVAGSLDSGANALFLFASTHGQLSLVAPIAALYPVSTVLLALGIDRERVRPVQLAGLGLAATALVLVAA